MKSPADMLKNQSYKEKLGDPRWKSFASEMRKLRGNCCQTCSQRGVLHVHHWFYDGREPWEYSPDEVTVLCEGCHMRLHEELQKFRQYVFAKLTPQAFRVLNGALKVALDQYHPLAFVYAVAEMASSPRSVERFADAWTSHPISKPAADQIAKGPQQQ